MDNIEQRMEYVEKRNERVEADKAWETSYSRKFLLTILTYLAVGFYLQTIDINEPWLNAMVPATAFMLSTLTLPYLKKFWLKYIYKK